MGKTKQLLDDMNAELAWELHLKELEYENTSNGNTDRNSQWSD